MCFVSSLCGGRALVLPTRKPRKSNGLHQAAVPTFALLPISIFFCSQYRHIPLFRE
jgi:hypothetical protein